MRLAEEAAARPGGISLVQIVDTFGVTLRTAQRMSRALEEAFPMVQTRTDRDRRKWWQLPDSRLLHLQGIRDGELSALEMGIRRAERDGATTEVTALTSLRNRLLATMSSTFARRVEVDAETVLEARGHACRPGPRAQYSAHVLGLIENALKGPFTMQIDYATGQDAKPRSRAVEPYGVLFGMRGYLIAREIGTGSKYRHYRLDRIVSASLLQNSFLRDPDFDLGTHAARAFGSFHSDKEYGPVEWRFAPTAAAVARAFVFHPDQHMQDEADGSLTVRFSAGGWLEMAWHLYQWGDAIEVIAPPEVRNLVHAYRRSDFPALP
ncbi:helix-turn-helix transcriptional regulator [Yoonia vestfoldensis]|uniref:helix-turn-helix transcriptional regulator n=1 Tax=Yoonia vestfoldensis TaxID=245188 RepID=UPI0003A39809|nr:WYL domain-containing protein [Yoonia vestfoldensis]